MVGAVLVCAAACSGGQAASVSRGTTVTFGSSNGTTTVIVHHHKRHRRHSRSARPKRKPAGGVPAVDMPRAAVTPGVALAAGKAQICVSGYAASVRNVPTSEADAVYAEYGVAHVAYAHEVDHLISLELGGSNVIRNLWPEPYAGRWGARTKDVLENKLHDLVCAGQLSLHYAQHIEATNWVVAYRRYVGGTPTASSSGSGSGGSGGSTSTGGYYLSSYPSASTIYCADDSEWRSLSKTYLRHYPTYAAAHRAYPSYHLHQPC
jgi:hypothetical protein